MSAARLVSKRFEPLLDITVLRPDAQHRAAPHVLAFASRYAPCAHLDLGNVCNLGCVYCGLDRTEATFASTRTVLATLDGARKAGLHKLALVGGEPTVRRDLVGLVAGARGNGFDEIVLTTNGLLLANGDLLERLIEAGLTAVHLSLDDHDEARLCALSRHPDAGRLVLQALDRLLSVPQLHLFLYAVLARATLAHLPAHVERVAEWSTRRGAAVPLVLTAPKPTGRAWDAAEAVLPAPGEAAAAVGAAHERAEQLGVPTLHRNLPDCLLPTWAPRAFEAALVEHRLALADDARLPAERADQDLHGPPCTSCAAAPTCTGVTARLIERFGWEPYRAIPGFPVENP